jgi:hypothetical protein
MSYRIIKLIIYLTKHIIIILYTNNKKKTYQTIFLFLFNQSVVNFLTINLLIFVKGKNQPPLYFIPVIKSSLCYFFLSLRTKITLYKPVEMCA